MLGYFLGIHQPGEAFSWQTFSLVILCMIFARSAAMAYNRYVDREIDEQNPRTQKREIPAGIIAPRKALIFTVINSIAFIVCTYFINTLCFALSPVALVVILGYSYTKRFTSLCHFILGLGLSFAPIGAYIAVTNQVDFLPVLYGFAVLFWVAGFDIIYALQDEEFDLSLSLISIPSSIGKKRAILISVLSHIVVAVLLLWSAWTLSKEHPEIGWIQWVGLSIFILLLIYQHRIVNHKDLSRINLAFFTTNGVASLLFAICIILDFYF